MSRPPAEERCDGLAARLDGLSGWKTTLAAFMKEARDERT
jgi:hypothetical protein